MQDQEGHFITFPLRKVPIRLWKRFTAKAQADGISRREKLLRLVEAEVRKSSSEMMMDNCVTADKLCARGTTTGEIPSDLKITA